jgi:hypothetical protein
MNYIFFQMTTLCSWLFLSAAAALFPAAADPLLLRGAPWRGDSFLPARAWAADPASNPAVTAAAAVQADFLGESFGMQAAPPEESTLPQDQPASLDAPSFKNMSVLGVLSKPATADISAVRTPAGGLTKKGKFLNLITWVRFTNDECAATTGDNGTCFTSSECTELGGKAAGSCASGFGVCCVLQVSIE